MALGASRGQVVAGIAGAGLRVVALGSIAGVTLVGISTPVVQTLFFNVSPLDPRILGGTCALLCIAGAVACVLPPWRAASIDPAGALREG